MSTWSWAVIVVLVVGWAALTLTLNLSRTRRLRSLAQSRAGTDCFARTCEALPQIRLDYLGELYINVRNLVPFRRFPLLPDDHLWSDLEIDAGTLTDFLETLVLGDEPEIDTFADLARAAWQNRRD